MKIAIKITFTQLEAVIKVFQYIQPPLINANRLIRANYSILYPLQDRFLKKAIDKRGCKKPFSISMQYHEAHSMETLLLGYNSIIKDHDVQCVIEILNQKLA